MSRHLWYPHFMNPIRWTKAPIPGTAKCMRKFNQTPEYYRGCSHERFEMAREMSSCAAGRVLQGVGSKGRHTQDTHAGHLCSGGSKTFRGGRGQNRCSDGRCRGKFAIRCAVVHVCANAGSKRSNVCDEMSSRLAISHLMVRALASLQLRQEWK